MLSFVSNQVSSRSDKISVTGRPFMIASTIRSLPGETRSVLKVRETQHGRSTKGEIRLIVQAAVQPSGGCESALRDVGKDLGHVSFYLSRDFNPPEPEQFA